MKKFLKLLTTTVLAITLLLVDGLPFMSQGVALAQTSTKPNILVIMGDDIGWFNISAYNDGIMGYRTPNIDKLAKEGVRFTDFYGEQSCTAGRAAFITGQATIRTGMTKVGLPGVPIGLQAEDPTLADLLKLEGYTTGQFGKNHLGDLDQFLPTAHGFDEFYGNLYHLNAEEEPENEDYPPLGKYPSLDGMRPRGVLHSYAGKGSHLPSLCTGGQYLEPGKPADISPSSGPNEKTLDQRICDTGPLTKKRMETVDEEFLGATKQFITNAENATDKKPFFVWFNTTRMHINTHLKDKSQGVTGQGIEADGMVEHDGQVGELVQFIKDQGLDDNTIIIYTTDNGAEVFSWPDGGTTPFRSEKNTNWEGAFRVPAIIRWKGHIPAGVVSNDIMSHLDWVPTLMAAAGVTDIKQQLLKVKDRAETIQEPIPTNKYEDFADENKGVHLDGYNFLPYLTETKSSLNTDYPDKFCHDINTETRKPDSSDLVICSPRHQFVYLTDDGYPAAMRYDDWKLLFSEQRAEGFNVWEEPFVDLRVPKLFNLRRDPFEKASVESDNYVDWRFRRVFLIGDMEVRLSKFLDTFRGNQYPPRQRPATFSVNYMVDDVLKDIQKTLETGYTTQAQASVTPSKAKLPSEFGVVVDQLSKIVDKLKTISTK